MSGADSIFSSTFMVPVGNIPWCGFCFPKYFINYNYVLGFIVLKWHLGIPILFYPKLRPTATLSFLFGFGDLLWEKVEPDEESLFCFTFCMNLIL